MHRLAGILFSLISTTLAGTAIVISLVMGHDTLQPIVIAAALGFAAAFPATWVVTRQIMAA